MRAWGPLFRGYRTFELRVSFLETPVVSAIGAGKLSAKCGSRPCPKQRKRGLPKQRKGGQEDLNGGPNGRYHRRSKTAEKGACGGLAFIGRGQKQRQGANGGYHRGQKQRKGGQTECYLQKQQKTILQDVFCLFRPNVQGWCQW